jgi:ATP-binding cassette subfamily B protein
MNVLKQFIENLKFTQGLFWGDYKKLAGFYLLITLAVASVVFVSNYFLAQLVEQISVAAGSDTFSRTIIFTLALVIVFKIAEPVFAAINTYLTKLVFMGLEHEYALRIVAKKAELDIAQWDNPEINNLINKINENGTWRTSNYTIRHFELSIDAIRMIIAMIIMAGFHWALGLLLMIFLIPQLYVEIIQAKAMWSVHNAKAEIRREYYEMKKQFESIPSLLELKLFQSARFFYRKMEKLLVDFLIAQKKADRKNIILYVATILLSQLAVGVAIVMLAQMLIKGQIGVAEFVFGMTSIASFTASLSNFFNLFGLQYEDNLFISDFSSFLNLRPVLEKRPGGLKVGAKAGLEIEFDRVSFNYPDKTERVLNGVSFKIGAGEKAALVGVNGAGKTTIVKLLCRFYDPTEGRILINGRDLREYDLEDWYENLGVLFQEYNNYNLLVKEAIAVGDSSKRIDMKKVEQAAELSGAVNFIEKYEGGYKQRLGHQFTKGIEPSVGQRQKLALARVFYRDPKLFILDEPTASIDAEAEAKIFEKLENLSDQKTVLLISHRFSTVRNADKILVIEDGKLKECGNHQKLMAEEGSYARLFKLQAKGYN